MELKFRKVHADEIDVRIGGINQYGVSLVLYKDARVDQNILDEAVGALNWQRHHSRDNANCVVSIYNPDIGQWVEKEDTGISSDNFKEKGLASDSFKRACFNWGIGRELYTAPQIFIGKECLKAFFVDDKMVRCRDSFKVSEIEYDGDKISSVTISDSFRDNISYYTFKNDCTKTESSKNPEPAQESSTHIDSENIEDDEIILIGNCKGMTYGAAKETATFKSFLDWVKNSNGHYKEPNQNIQFAKFKKLAQKED